MTRCGVTDVLDLVSGVCFFGRCVAGELYTKLMKQVWTVREECIERGEYAYFIAVGKAGR